MLGGSQSDASKRGHGEAFYVDRTNVFYNDFVQIKDLKHCDIDDKLTELRPGDLLLTSSGGHGDEAGTACVVGDDIPEHTYFGDFMFAYRPLIKFSQRYLTNVMQLDQVRSQMAALSQQGTSMANIKVKDIMRVKIPVMPYEEQVKLAKTLQVFDERIHYFKKRDKELAKIKDEGLRTMFVD